MAFSSCRIAACLTDPLVSFTSFGGVVDGWCGWIRARSCGSTGAVFSLNVAVFASAVSVLALAAGAGVTRSGAAMTGLVMLRVGLIRGVASSVQVACTGAGGVASTGAVVPASTGLYFLRLELGVLL